MKKERKGLIESLCNTEKMVIAKFLQSSAQCGCVRSAGGGAPV